MSKKNTESRGIDTISRYVAGVDGSADGLRAVEYATRGALVVNGSVHLVHAVDVAVMAGAWGAIQDVEAMEKAGQQTVERAVARAIELGIPSDRITSEVVMGNPTAVLSDASKSADRLVVGRRRMGGLERMFVGSTSASLAAVANCPLIVISAAVNPDETGGRKVVAVGVDGEGHSETTLRAALTEARSRGARIIVTHIQPAVPVGMFGGYQLTADAERELLSDARTAITEMVTRVAGEHPDVETEVLVQTGDPVDRLVELSREVDLLILGMRAPTVLGFAIGGMTRAVLAHAESPLMVVR
ncbi:universal stress protein [Propionibacteriaceae bacterium G1746]|uniref:universal stress protein n=1 Tax=Aestuariimicrobium sp. G57 TaxID=3418485 RepID=UPI003C22315B